MDLDSSARPRRKRSSNSPQRMPTCSSLWCGSSLPSSTFVSSAVPQFSFMSRPPSGVLNLVSFSSVDVHVLPHHMSCLTTGLLPSTAPQYSRCTRLLSNPLQTHSHIPFPSQLLPLLFIRLLPCPCASVVALVSDVIMSASTGTEYHDGIMTLSAEAVRGWGQRLHRAEGVGVT